MTFVVSSLQVATGTRCTCVFITAGVTVRWTLFTSVVYEVISGLAFCAFGCSPIGVTLRTLSMILGTGDTFFVVLCSIIHAFETLRRITTLTIIGVTLFT